MLKFWHALKQSFLNPKWKAIAQHQAQRIEALEKKLAREQKSAENWTDVAFDTLADFAKLEKQYQNVKADLAKAETALQHLKPGSNFDFERKVWEWSEHNWPGRTPEDILTSTTEELGEVARCIAKAKRGIRGTPEYWDSELKKEIGDVTNNLIDLCYIKGWSFSDVVRDRFNEVKVRDWQKFPKNGKTE